MVSTNREARLLHVAEPTVQQEILQVGASWQTAQHRLLHLIVELDETGGWEGQGHPSCAHWVAAALDIEVCTAREWLRIGRALKRLPHVDAALEAGVSYSKVRALTRVASPANEQELLEIAYRTPAGNLAGALARWLAAHEDPQQTEARHRAARCLSSRLDPDGMISGRFRLPPLEGRALLRAVDETVRRSVPPDPDADAPADASAGRWPSLAQQRADALVALVAGGGTDFVTEIVISVGPDGGSFPDGTPIPWPVLERVAPESFVRALVHDAEGRPVNASSRRRHPSVRQRRVVDARHGGRCVICGSTDLVEYHHDPPFAQSGHTVVEEIEPRCYRCHRAAH